MAMIKKYIAIFIAVGLLSTSLTAVAEILPAKELNSISEQSTAKAIQQFKSDPKANAAYKETANFIGDKLLNLAQKGFYTISVININTVFNKEMLINKLADKQKNSLKSILKQNLINKGYTVQEGQHNNIGIHWIITWKN